MIKEFLVKNTLFRKRLKALRQKQILYNKIKSNDGILAYQLNQFNNIWDKALKNIPFYKKWQRDNSLPNKISSIEELHNFPPLTKKDIQNNKDLIFSNIRHCKTISTGGTTGEPLKIPASRSMTIDNYANVYMARGWWDIKPLDKFFIFWGHSHLFGKGITGQLNQYKRVLADWLINVKKMNAYDVSVDTINSYYKVFFESNPVTLLGYTSIIFKLARFIKDNNLSIGNKSNLRGVIITAETATKADIDLINNVFNVPVIIEYGLAETGVVAYSRNTTNNIEVFWDSFIAQTDEKGILYLTNFSNELFPLINYRSDDLVIIKKEVNSSILALDSIKGRTKDVVTVKTVNNKCLELSGILLIHILKSYPNIYGINFEQLEKCQIKINVVSDKNLDMHDIKNYFIKRIKKDHKEIDPAAITIKQIDEIEKTIAGKEEWIKVER